MPFALLLAARLAITGGLLFLVPLPDFMSNMPSYTLPASAAWWFEPFQIEYGIGVVLSAYSARFVRKLLIGH